MITEGFGVGVLAWFWRCGGGGARRHVMADVSIDLTHGPSYVASAYSKVSSCVTSFQPLVIAADNVEDGTAELYTKALSLAQTAPSQAIDGVQLAACGVIIELRKEIQSLKRQLDNPPNAKEQEAERVVALKDVHRDRPDAFELPIVDLSGSLAAKIWALRSTQLLAPLFSLTFS